MPELILLVRAGPQVAFAIERKTVGTTAGLQEIGERAVEAPLHNAIVGLVREKDIAPRIAGWAFGEQVVARELLQSLARSDDRALGGHQRRRQ